LEPWKDKVVNKKDFDHGLYTGETILHIAIVTCDYKAVQFLLDRGASLDARATGVFFMPQWISNQNTQSYFQKLKSCFLPFTSSEVNKNHNEYSQCPYGEFPLSFAASIGKVDVCKLIYEHAQRKSCTSIICAEDSFGNTALHMAVLHQHQNVVDWLMTIQEGKSCLEKPNQDGLTPLTLAARNGYVEMYHHLLDKHLSRVAWVFGEVHPTRRPRQPPPPPPPPPPSPPPPAAAAIAALPRSRRTLALTPPVRLGALGRSPCGRWTCTR
jgi:ankyrin repeat protein